MKMQLNRRILKFLISSLLLIVVWQGGFCQESKGFVVDKIIGKVDNYIILRSELEGTFQNYLSNGGTNTEQAKCQLFNQLVINKLLVAKAEIDSVLITDLEVDNNTRQRMNMILQSYGNSPEQLEKTLGKTLDQFQLELRDQVREQMLGNRMRDKVTANVDVTPAEVKRFFNRIPSDSLPFYSADVEVGQIVRVAKVSPSQEAETKLKLSQLRERILSGENFNELAKKYSEDPSAQQNYGEMNYVGRGAMVPEYEAMAFRIKKGEISQPFKSSFGFHIMQLLDRRGNEYNSRHILISATPSADDIVRAEHFLDSLRRKILKDSIKFEKAAKEFSDDQRSKGFGGFFTDEDNGLKVSIKELDPIVYFTIDTMKEGSISRPIVYRTDDLKNAVRILYFKKRLPPHQASLNDDWFRIQNAALAQKKDKMLAKWFTKARQDVFINLDPTFKGCGILE